MEERGGECEREGGECTRLDIQREEEDGVGWALYTTEEDCSVQTEFRRTDMNFT